MKQPSLKIYYKSEGLSCGIGVPLIDVNAESSISFQEMQRTGGSYENFHVFPMLNLFEHQVILKNMPPYL